MRCRCSCKRPSHLSEYRRRRARATDVVPLYVLPSTCDCFCVCCGTLIIVSASVYISSTIHTWLRRDSLYRTTNSDPLFTGIYINGPETGTLQRKGFVCTSFSAVLTRTPPETEHRDSALPLLAKVSCTLPPCTDVNQYFLHNTNEPPYSTFSAPVFWPLCVSHAHPSRTGEASLRRETCLGPQARY